MEPVLAVAFLWLLFGGAHLALAAEPIRGRLVGRLGEMGFLALFWALAALTFALLVHGYAERRALGPPGLGLGGVPALRPLLIGIAGAGVALMLLMDYPRTPTALFGQPIQPPRGIQRVTRHPFFAGAVLLAGAHALLATRLVGTIFFGGLTLFVVAGVWHQERKILARRGAAYADHLAVTSAVPFAAVVAGRQRLVWRELSPIAVALAIAGAIALRLGHGLLMADGGAWVIAVVIAGAARATVQSWRRSRRVGDLAAGIRPERRAGSVR
jgi:uncharacterized membrane protein